MRVCIAPCEMCLKIAYLPHPSGNSSITVLRDGHAVSRISDWIMYSVEAEYIDRVVAEYGPCTIIYLPSGSSS